MTRTSSSIGRSASAERVGAPSVGYEAYMTIVEQAAGTEREQAEQAMRATLQTLGERIDREEARQLGALLPAEIAPFLATTTPAERFDADEFVLRVAERERVDATTAQRHAAAVLEALARTVPDKEWNDVVAELPRNFAPLLPRGPFIKVVDAETFLERVAERAGIDRPRAQLAAEAVLETFAEGLAAGEVDNLMLHLPLELHPPLKRGRASGDGQTKPMKLELFVQLVAEREGVSLVGAALHSRAVFRALRETVGEEQFRDISAPFVKVLAR
jgi:uncharacterized protein (DUF2267 family)